VSIESRSFDVAPVAADLPGAEGNFADLPAGLSKRSVFHEARLSLVIFLRAAARKRSSRLVDASGGRR